MGTLVLLIVVVAAALLLAQPATQRQSIFVVPLTVDEPLSSGLGCLPLLILLAILLLVLMGGGLG